MEKGEKEAMFENADAMDDMNKASYLRETISSSEEEARVERKNKKELKEQQTKTTIKKNIINWKWKKTKKKIQENKRTN